jgi:hypothetical protein
VSLNVGAGSLTSDATIGLTAVSRQGLAALLPVGWTPVATVDIAPYGVTFATPATLTVPLPLQLPANTPLTLVQFDQAARVWRAVSAAAAIPQSTTALTATMSSSGQFAWVLADTLPLAPPPGVPGEPLVGVAASLIPVTAAAVVDPQPRIIFYQPGVKSDVRGRLTTTQPLSSGTLARTRMLEPYQFFSGAQMQHDPTTQDVVLYQVPGSGGTSLVAEEGRGVPAIVEMIVHTRLDCVLG